MDISAGASAADSADGGKRRRTENFNSLASMLISKPKKTWSPEEDEKLTQLINTHGEGNWTYIANCIEGRSGKQCRERWHNHLSPAVNKGEWTEEEDRIIRDMRKVVGNQWSLMRKYLVGRSDNAIKNRFNAAERCKGIKVKKPKAFESDEIPSSVFMATTTERQSSETSADLINVNRFDTASTSMFSEADFCGLDDADLKALCSEDFNFDFLETENEKYKMDTTKSSSSSSSSSVPWDCNGCSVIKANVNNFLKPKLRTLSEEKDVDRLV